MNIFKYLLKKNKIKIKLKKLSPLLPNQIIKGTVIKIYKKEKYFHPVLQQFKKKRQVEESRRGIVGRGFPTILPSVWKYEKGVLRYTKRNRNIGGHTDPNVI